MTNETDILKHFIDWAQNHELVRAAILTSSRVHPERVIDDLSDYDIELFVSDITTFQKSDDWLNAFGSIMMRWPRHPELGVNNNNSLTRMAIFDNEIRFDFQITDCLEISANAYPDGYRVLIDKDGLAQRLNSPTYDEFQLDPPTADEFDHAVCGFWWDADYVAKHLYRDELPFAKIMFNEIRAQYLHKALDWYIGINNQWHVNTGKGGRWFKSYLDEKTWRNFGDCFAGLDIEENWQAFFNTLSLFRTTAKHVAKQLGYEYPDQIDQKATKRFKRIYNMQACVSPDTARLQL